MEQIEKKKKETTWIDLVKHIAFALLTVLVVVLGTFYVIFPIVTNHGESMTVPNLEGISLEDLEEFLDDRDLRFEVETDSGYSSKYPPLAVLKQFPLAGSKVKENRKIYVTLNATDPPKVKLPSLKGRSLKNAQLELRSLGLELGEITYKPDFALNTVLGQFYKGTKMQEGQEIPKGTKVDFEVGDGLGTQTFQMLDLKELDLEEAEFVLRGYGLSLGDVFYKDKGTVLVEEEDDEGEKKWVEKEVGPGKIFKQSPRAKNRTKIGTSVDLWVVEIDSTSIDNEAPSLGVLENN